MSFQEIEEEYRLGEACLSTGNASKAQRHFLTVFTRCPKGALKQQARDHLQALGLSASQLAAELRGSAPRPDSPAKHARSRGTTRTHREGPSPMKRKATEFAQQNGIPVAAAYQVLRGQLSVEAFKTRQERKRKALQLAGQLQIDHGLACQILDGTVSLRRLEENRRRGSSNQENWTYLNNEGPEFEWYRRAVQEKTALVFKMNKARTHRARLKRVGRYLFDVLLEDGKREQWHKMRIQYIYPRKVDVHVKKARTQIPRLRRKNLTPSFMPEERYRLPEELLRRSMEDRAPLTFLTMRGDRFRGFPEWLSPYEILVRLGTDGPAILLMRHALHEVSVPGGTRKQSKSPVKT